MDLVEGGFAGSTVESRGSGLVGCKKPWEGVIFHSSFIVKKPVFPSRNLYPLKMPTVLNRD